MSKALKCDRCGEFFDPADPRFGKTMQFYNPAFYTSESIQKKCVAGYFSKGDNPIDLCADCTKAFISFMEGNELAMEASRFDFPDIPKT